MRICLHIPPRPSSLEPCGLSLTFLFSENSVAGTCEHDVALERFFSQEKHELNRRGV